MSGITVELSDGRTVTASVVGTDQGSDLAVIQADDVSGLRAATFGDSDELQVVSQLTDGVQSVTAGSGVSRGISAVVGIVAGLGPATRPPRSTRPPPFATNEEATSQDLASRHQHLVQVAAGRSR